MAFIESSSGGLGNERRDANTQRVAEMMEDTRRLGNIGVTKIIKNSINNLMPGFIAPDSPFFLRVRRTDYGDAAEDWAQILSEECLDPEGSISIDLTFQPQARDIPFMSPTVRLKGSHLEVYRENVPLTQAQEGLIRKIAMSRNPQAPDDTDNTVINEIFGKTVESQD